MKEYITKFSLERQAWDRLLLQYQNEVPPEEMPRGSTETKINEVNVDPAAYLRSSQKEVLNTKPDYQRIVQSQNEVFAYMELVMDELQGAVKQLQAFMDESTQYLQKVSVQLKKRSMEQLDSSPARKLLKLHLQSSSTTQWSGSCQGSYLTALSWEVLALQHFHCSWVTAYLYPEESVKDTFVIVCKMLKMTFRTIALNIFMVSAFHPIKRSKDI